MTGRKCSSCKHYEPAPIWRKGWCRNPLLYAPQQSHLVGEDDLDCERGMGNYWEPAELAAIAPTIDEAGFQEPVPNIFAGVPASPPPWYSVGGQPIYAVSGSSGYSEPPTEPPNGGRGSLPPGRERQLDYYEEERYWTDYLRIAAPVLGVILIVILFWIWANSFLGGDDDDDTTGGATGTVTGTLPIIGASPTGTITQAAGGTPTIAVIRTVSVTPPEGEPTPTTGNGEPEPTAPTDGGDPFVGAIVEVANTGGEGANLRSDATTTADVVTVLLDGVQLEVIGGPVEADEYIWWQVTGTADGVEVTGWIVQDFLNVIG